MVKEALKWFPGADEAEIVQDFVPNSLEARAYVVNGQIVHTVFTTFGETDADGYQVDFARKEREAALGAWLDGDDEGFFGQARNCAALEACCLWNS